MAAQIGPAALGKTSTYQDYSEIYKAVFPSASFGELISEIDLYCQYHQSEQVKDALIALAARQKARKGLEKQ